MSALKRIVGLSVPVLALSAAASAAQAAGGPIDAETASGTTLFWWIAPISALCALGFAFYFYKKMIEAPAGTEKMVEIAQYVREGAYAYLRRQYSVVAVVFAVLVALFAFLAYKGIQNPFVPVAFLTGGFFSGLCGFLGMKTATAASSRTAQGASKSLNSGLQVAFRSGAVMGLVVVGFGLLDISLWYLILDKLVYTPEHMKNGLTLWGLTLVHPGMDPQRMLVEITTTMITFGMGASTQALFARVGGGIYTKSADVGADLVGKVEAGIPEDDPRNPATIADNVGDNVGDVAGMGADLYESYCGSILATAALGAALPLSAVAASGMDPLKAVLAPMIVAGIGILLSIVGVFMVRCKEDASQKNLLRALLLGTLGSSVLILVVLAGLAMTDWISWGIFGSVVSGLVAGVLIGQFTEYYTSDEYKPTKGIANQARMGPATTIIDGFANGMYSAGLPVVTIVIGILCAYGFAGGFSDVAMGLYGIGFAAVGMLSTLGITLATDAYGPIADNAGGNAEMAGLDPEVRKRTDALDALGNTTAATGKGFAIGSAALTAMALLAAYIEEIRIWIGRLAQESADGIYHVGKIAFAATDGVAGAINARTATMTDFVNAYDLTIMNPKLIGGLFIGGMMAFVFCAMTMKAVGRAAGAMVEEVRRQFKDIPGIMQGTGKPDYARCVSISTKGAQREMILPSLLAIIVPVVTGLLMGVSGVMGLLVGGLTTGFVLAITLNNAGGAWDNAKKYIEKGAHGGKKLPDGTKNPVHGAAVIGDTVGDPFKDTSGPSLNILIKLMSMVSVVFSGVIVKFAPQVSAWLHLGSQ
ncbi:MAG: sodium-translocating pyrophosphatase [Sedimentisphaerales bacterium]|nr:sodium-translocating pyrophosphatase [Sedimentisphaerales bacterium]HNY77701.1 sodium-translocating pyrophosphatase [Sedimentisphaerales bacterium]HOC63445.1 sodium-translocating pyrophosphatase [Sedimentisphaerales bacterium]HOH63876.1 sodium-translocating pyrophosphatase [Sedimentisphaerales bacterium]HQA92275.1 sodium-translocating pyrophosphatase [Sedimentisphaerales bacterium]